LPKKSKQNSALNIENLNFEIPIMDEVNSEQFFPSELEMKWRKQKEKITNANNINYSE
jgi:hypothetical protein